MQIEFLLRGIGWKRPDVKQSCRTNTLQLVFLWYFFFLTRFKCSSSHLLLYQHCGKNDVSLLLYLYDCSDSVGPDGFLQDSATLHTIEVHATRCEMPHSKLTTSELANTYAGGFYLMVVFHNISSRSAYFQGMLAVRAWLSVSLENYC